MAIIERKKVTQQGIEYMVSRAEFPDRIEYQAWEKELASSRNHDNVYKEDKATSWGSIDSRHFPVDIQTMTPRSDERIKAEADFRKKGRKLAYDLITAVFNDRTMNEALSDESSSMSDSGKITIKRDKAVQLEEPKSKPDTRKSIVKDEVRELLEVAALPRLKELAQLNGVPLKEKDNAGLLKMRLANALRQKLKRGETIKIA